MLYMFSRGILHATKETLNRKFSQLHIVTSMSGAGEQSVSLFLENITSLLRRNIAFVIAHFHIPKQQKKAHSKKRQKLLMCQKLSKLV